MKKIVIITAISALLLFLVGGLIFIFINKKIEPNKISPDLVEKPPQISKINSLSLDKRPFVALVPHANPATCDGFDMLVESLKNNEKSMEYLLEYESDNAETPDPDDQRLLGVSGNRDFAKPEVHAPLELGTCSGKVCHCDVGITGGSLKLSFVAETDYVIKADFNLQNVGEHEGILTSKDARLTIETKGALDDNEAVVIMSTLGLPQGLSDKVLLGPYGIFAEDISSLDDPISATLQSKDASKGKIQFWTGESWQVIDANVDGDKITFEFSKLGVFVLTE